MPRNRVKCTSTCSAHAAAIAAKREEPFSTCHGLGVTLMGPRFHFRPTKPRFCKEHPWSKTTCCAPWHPQVATINKTNGLGRELNFQKKEGNMSLVCESQNGRMPMISKKWDLYQLEKMPRCWFALKTNADARMPKGRLSNCCPNQWTSVTITSLPVIVEIPKCSSQLFSIEANVGWWCWWFMWQLTWLNYTFLEQTARYSKTTDRSPGCNPSIPSGFITAEVELSSPSQGLPMIVEIDHPGDDAEWIVHPNGQRRPKSKYTVYISCTDFQRNQRWSLGWHDFWKTPSFFTHPHPPTKRSLLAKYKWENKKAA